MVYGYCRISRKIQNIERQEHNILAIYPDAVICKEAFTGTKIHREKMDQLRRKLRSGDTVVFDSVSRMSRNADEGMELYEELFAKGVNMVFLKEPQCNSDTYKKSLQEAVPMTGTAVDLILEGINKYLMVLAKEQVRLSFDQAEKEVDDLHQRTREGIRTARNHGKQIGQKPGAKLNVKKAATAKVFIR